MLNSTKSTVQTSVNAVLQRVSPDYQSIKNPYLLVSTDAEIWESQKGRPVKSSIARDFEWFEYNQGCLK